MINSTRFVRKGAKETMGYEELDAVRIGNRIKGLREKRQETMMDLSRAVGTSESAIGMYESGKRVPRDEIKIRIAEHFAVSVESIFFPNKQHVTCDMSA